MSWPVQTLLFDSIKIREKSDIESDEFNDLILLEDKLDELISEGLISDEEIFLLNLIKEGYDVVYISNLTGKRRQTIFDNFYELCERIAYCLGGEFTDEGYLTMMQEKYNLNEEQVNIMKQYISGQFKHKILKNSLYKR